MNLIEFDKLIKENYDINHIYECMAYRLGTVWGLYDPTQFDLAKDFFDRLNKSKTATELDNLYNEYLSLFRTLMGKTKSESKIDNTINMINAVFVVNLLDNTLEYGKIQEKTLNQIKQTYGNNYLNAISKVDKENLSLDGLKYAKSKSASKEIDESLKIYLSLKKWNDTLHLDMVNNFDTFMELSTQYLNIQKDNNFYYVELVAQDLLSKTLKNAIYSDEEISILYRSAGKDFILNNFGGKVLGLARLKILNLDIPQMWCISTNSAMTNFDNLDKNKHYAIRSSANIEDGQSKSFAGMFDSFLNIPQDKIGEYVLKVKASASNNRVITYCAQNNLPPPQMAVIIQEYNEPTKAGVWFSKDAESGILEWVDGNGEKLVSGTTTPTAEVLSLNDLNKYENKSEKCAETTSQSVGIQLLKIQKEIIGFYNFLPDIEWCVVNNQLKLVQLRPITKKITQNLSKQNDQAQNESNNIITGIACCEGEATGEICYISDFDEMQNFKQGSILMVDYTSPEYIDIMLKSKAIIGIYGGFLCHAGIIAREFNIPCITGVGEQAKQKLLNKKVALNATNGTIKILS